MKSSLPKVLHPLCGRTLLGHTIHTARAINPHEVIVVVRHDRDRVAQHAQDVDPDVKIADQDDIPGTGRAVQCALEQAQSAGLSLGRTVLVTSGDVPLLSAETLQALVKKHEEEAAAVTLVTAFPEDPSGYGRVIRESARPELVARIVEDKDASSEEKLVGEINAGIYAFDTEFLTSALADLGQDNAQGEVYLTDTVAAAVLRGEKAVPFVLRDRWQAEGCNDLVQLADLREELTRRLCVSHMLAGARIMDPKRVSIDVQAVLEPDCIIHPGTELLGATFVAAGAEVGPHTTLDSVEVGPGARVAHSYLQGGVLNADQVVPPFTYQHGESVS